MRSLVGGANLADMIFNERFGDRVNVDSGRGELKCDELLRRFFVGLI